MHLEEELRNYIFNQLASGKNPGKFDNDDDLVEKGVLDSLAFVSLLSY